MKSTIIASRAHGTDWSWFNSTVLALMPVALVEPPSASKLLAFVALFFGAMFFLYALKYYVSIALILIANGNGNGDGNGNGNGHKSNGHKNGNGNGYGLKGLARNGGDKHKLPYHPFISIHLPMFNEPAVVDRLLQSCTSLAYDNYEVVVADDSTDETSRILDQRWSGLSRVKISRRKSRAGFKGGALQQALQVTDPRAEFIAVFDADFIPPPDILQQFLSYFYGINGNGNGHAESERPQLIDDRLAVVQGYQWHILNASENWITRGIRTEFAGSYVIERSSQELIGAMKMISGSVFMVRADVMRQHGWGTSITEDWELTLRLYLSGYKVLYTPFIQAPSECVATFKQLAHQRMRWAEGHTFNVKKYFSQILSSPNLSFPEKLEFIYFAPYYLQSIFFILGTGCWLLSELVFRYRLPMLPATLGWALVFSNALSLVMMNLTGLFMERGVRRNWSGLLSFVLLTYMLVPYQAYAALKGLIEPHEGGWHRTQKTGVITDIVDKLGLGKRMRRLLPKQKRSKDGGFDLGRRLGIPAAKIAARLPEPIRRRARGISLGVRVASGLAALLVLLAILAGGISVVSAAPDAFYLHTPPLNDGESMNTATGAGTASLVFDTPGQTARWYSSLNYPGGGGDSTLDAGAYTMNLYFDALPGGGWWDANYAIRQQLTISTGALGVSTGHEIAITFDHASLVAAGKSLSSGDDLRLAYFNGLSWVELDRVRDPLTNWDSSNTKLWFALVSSILPSSSDNNYYLYYDNPAAGAPPADLNAIFNLADDFEDGTLSVQFLVSTSGAATVDEDFGEAIIYGGSDDGDAAIILPDSALPFNRRFAIRTITKLESGDSGFPPSEATLLGVVESQFDPQVTSTPTEDARRRIMVTHQANTRDVFIFYLDTSDTLHYWTGAAWTTTLTSWTNWPLNTYRVVELVSAGTNWWVIVRDMSGTALTQTTPVAWAAVQDAGDDFWSYWGEVYTDQHWAFQSTDWLDIRDYVSPEPSVLAGSEEGIPSVDVTVRVHHTRPDGTDPQLIMSNTTTITPGTADPLAFSLGSAAAQTFTSTDPRKLRLEIQVNNVTNAGSFTLAYDSAADQSRLETPSITVLDVALILAIVGVFIPIITALATERRRMATRLISVILALFLALAVLASQVIPVTANPDSFYLHDTSPGVSFEEVEPGGDGKDYNPPDGDVAVTNWTDLGGNSIHFDELDETTTDDDTTYTQTSAASGGTGDDLQVSLANFPDPLNNVYHVVEYRWRNAGNSTGDAAIAFSAELLQGTTVIASQSQSAATVTAQLAYTTSTFTLSGAQADSITDYNDLRIRFNVTTKSAGSSGSRILRVSWAALTVNWPLSVSTSASLTAATSHLYLAAISTKNASSVVQSVSGLGLTWSFVDRQCGGRNQTMVEVWKAIGTPTVDGVVTASFDVAEHNAVISVSRYSGVNTASPIGAVTSANSVGVNGACSGGTDALSGSVNLTTTAANSYAYGAFALRSRDMTGGTGYAVRDETYSGVASGEIAGVGSEDKLVATASTVAVDATFNNTLDWAVVAVEIKAAGTSPAGKTMDGNVGTGAATLSFNTSGQNAYWYTGRSYPTGSGDASIAAGNYSLNMYFNSLPAAGFPQVATTATSDTTTNATASTSHTVNLPSGIQSGDLLIVVFSGLDPSNGPIDVNWPTGAAGWTEFFEQDAANGTINQAVAGAWRKADGTEGASITVTTTVSARSAHNAYRITGAADPAIQPPQSQGFSYTTTGSTIDPPSLTPTGGAKDYLWLAVGAWRYSGITATVDPTNYTDPIEGTSAGTGSMTKLRSLRRQLNSASENPGAFTLSGTSSEVKVGATIAIHPVAAPSVDVQVTVSHTALDGSGATTIVQSSTTTINSSTPDPLPLSIGSGALQTFTAASPRLLRVNVQVTGVSGSGFVLDYDGTCASSKCSSLDTPAVTVPDVSLLLVAVVGFVPAVTLVLTERRRRRVAMRLISIAVSVLIALGLLSKDIVTAVAAPDVFYLHANATTGLAPAGEYTNTTLGTGASTKSFNSSGQNAYWYTDVTYPPGAEDSGLAAGNYTLNMYFNQLPRAWWNSSYGYRQPITVTAGSTAIASGYPVSLTFNHAALVTAAKSLASGNDVRIVFWNGSSWVEVARALGSGSAWNSTTTKITFKTQAQIAASGSDSNYYLYYGNSGAAAPPTGTPSARYFQAESLAEQTRVNNTAYSQAASLTFTPGATNEVWVYFATFAVKSSVAQGQQDSTYLARTTINGSEDIAVEQQNNEADRYKMMVITGRITGTTAAQIIGVDIKSAQTTTTTTIKNIRIVASLLPPNADFQFAGNDPIQSIANCNFCDVANPQLVFSPSSAGDYYVIAVGQHSENPGNANSHLRLVDHTGAFWPSLSTVNSYRSVNNRGPFDTFFVMQKVNLTTGSKTFKFQFSNSGNGSATASEVKGLRILVFRADAFEAAESVENIAVSTTTSTSPIVKSTLTTAAPPAARDYLVVQSQWVHDEDTSTTHQELADFRRGSTVLSDQDHVLSSGGYVFSSASVLALNTSTAQTYENRFWSNNSVATLSKDSVIHVLRWAEPGTSAGSEETDGVKIVVTASHTAADGSGATTIVQSSTLTINSNTTNPVALNLGSGAQQTFTSANPRRIRVQVNVTGVNSGESFVLAYDSGTNPANLETPALTVPDVSLLFVVLVALIPALTLVMTERRRRRLAMRLISFGVSGLLALAILSKDVITAVAAPDAFYLHTTVLNGGEMMNITTGASAATKVFNTPGQTADWFTELTYPTGGGDATLSAGAYSFYMYFDALPTGSWWNSSHGYRQPVTVSTGSAAAPSGYTVSVTFDHAAMVTAGKSLASGNDARIVYWNGSSWVELDRFLDLDSSWNSATTKLWFKTQASIGSSSSDANYYIYYGNPAAANPPANRSNVFFFADGFENNSFSAWGGTAAGAGDFIATYRSLDLGTGGDGSVAISGASNINANILGSLRSGSADGIATTVTANPTGTSISVTSTTGFAAGDEILVINLRGASGNTDDVGMHEFRRIASVPNGTTLTLTSAVQKSYDGSSFAAQRVIVQRVPQWTTVTISSGGSLTANDWNGTTGGVLVFRATGAVNINTGGSLNINAKGFRGAAGTTGSNVDGTAGESYGGTGSQGPSNNLGGGGGGDQSTAGDVCGEGGAGGSHGSTGTAGGYGASCSPSLPTNSPGATYSHANLNKALVGSGGGSGANDSDASGGTSGAGGAGGGLVIISADSITVSGALESLGADGGTYTSDCSDNGSGGAGSGGSIYLTANTTTLGSSLVRATGGTGGSSSCGDGPWHGAGGNGGSGRVRVEATSISGTTSPSADTDGLPPVHTGTYAAKAFVDNGTSAPAENNFTGQNGLHTTVWIYLPSDYTASHDVSLVQFYNGGWTTQQGSLSIEAGTRKPFIWNNVAGQGYFSDTALSLGAWHRLEMRIIRNTDGSCPTTCNGRAELWVDGVRKVNESARNTGSGTFDHNLVGIFWKSANYEVAYVDDSFDQLWVDPQPAAAAGAEQTPPSVNVTVSVHHTKADGTVAQLITSATTTITSSTADPFAFALGAGSQKTFTQADPQRVRVRVTVNSVNNGGSFTLAYNTVADPSNLETPSLTVPELSLLFTAVALLIPVLTAMLTMRRKRAVRLITVMVSFVAALMILAGQVEPVTAAPDTFYLHNSTAGGASWYNSNWQYRKKITIQDAQVTGSSNFSNFPVLINTTDPSWKDTANGGKVAKANGGDMLFTASDGTTKLDHEIEKYVNTSGQLVAWVEVPTLNATANTDIYVYYGYASAADQWNITGTWDQAGANTFKAVWHLKETSGAHLDSTANAHSSSAISVATQGSAVGRANGADSFGATNQQVTFPDSADWDLTGSFTLEAWVNGADVGPGVYQSVVARNNAGNTDWEFAILANHGGNTRPACYYEATAGANSSVDLNSNAWTHIVCVWDGSTAIIYVDGVNRGSSITNPGIANTSTSLFIGDTSFSQGYVGVIDEVRISNTARSADWIQTEFNNQSTPASFYIVGMLESYSVSPTGKSFNTTLGSAGSTLAFDTGGQNAYWYADTTWPTNGDNGGIAAGAYALNMYFSELPRPWWSSNYAYRQRVTVTAGSASVPSGYSTSLTINHASLVSGGKSISTGDDLRVVYWNGSSWVELDRSLDELSSWSNAATKIWLRTQAAISASGSDANYYLYYGNPLAITPPANKSNVFDLWDDFTAGSDPPTSWTEWSDDSDIVPQTVSSVVSGGVVTINSGGGKVGGIKHNTYTTGNTYGFEARTRVRSVSTVTDDLAPTCWFINDPAGQTYCYETRGARNRYVRKLAIDPIPAEVVIQSDTTTGPFAVADIWYVYEVRRLTDGTMRAIRDGSQQFPPGSGWSTADTNLTSGAFGLGGESCGAGCAGGPAGGENYQFDWVWARKLVDPEPTSGATGEETSANVNIVVTVSHTAADGTGATTIISSSTTTINSSTANPMALSIGSGSAQTFTSSDPRRLRVQVNVTSASSGERFILKYDGTCASSQCSNLDSPVVTVPDFGLAFLILVPLIPFLMAAIWRRKRLAGSLASFSLGAIMAISILAGQVMPTTAAPDIFYLHNGSTAAWYSATWLYRKPITIQSSQVPGSSNFSYFPVLINTTDTTWKDTTNGGKVQQPDGGDILFTLSDGTTKLDHEIEKYVNTTGQLIAWVEVPTLYATRETLIYIYYGTSSGVADQWNITGTWNEGGAANFEAVWHITEEVAGTGTAGLYQDSTANNHDGNDLVTATGQTGKINGGHDFVNGDIIRIPDPGGAWDFNPNNGLDAGTSDFSISAWVRLSSSDANGFPTIVIKGGGGPANAGYWFAYEAGVDGFRHNISNGTVRFIANSNTSIGLTRDVWHHLFVVTDREAGSDVVYFYLDGNPIGSESSTTIAGTSATGTANFDFADGIWTGSQDEVRVASTVRSADWVMTEYNNQNSPSTFYKIGPEQTGTISPAGKTMNTIEGSAGSTQTFNAVGSSYWYTDQHWPIGGDNATIAAGAYTLNMYFNALPGDATSVNDTFTEGANTAVTAHTPDEGTGWTEVYDNTTATTDATIVASTDIVRAGSVETSTGQAYTVQPAPTSTSQSISFTLAAVDTTTTNTRQVGLFARRTDNSNFYYFRLLPNLHASDSVALFKMVGGATTQLGTVDRTLANGDTFTLVVTDAAKKVYHNGVEIMSSSDNALTSVGTWGMFFGNFNGTGGNLSQVWEVTSFQAGNPTAWWDSTYAKRKQLTLTAPASGLATAYPVKLQFDHAALVSASDSQADGDDIRIVYSNGYVTTEVSRVLFNSNLTASAWNLSNTTILFKTQAAIAGSGSDAGYYLYYKNAAAAGPPTNTPSSRFYIAQSTAETQTTSTTYASKVQLQFTPSATTEHWVVVATWRQRRVGNVDVTSWAGRGQIRLNGATRVGNNDITYLMAGNVWKTFAVPFKITGTTAQQTINIDFASYDAANNGISNAQIVAFLIPNPSAADIQYAEALANVATAGAGVITIQSLTWTPSSAGNYIWLASGFTHERPGGGSVILSPHDEAGTKQQETDETYVTANTDGFVPLIHFEQRNMTTGSKTLTIRIDPDDTAGSDRRGLTQLVFRADVFDAVVVGDAAANSTTTSTTYVSKTSVTTASVGSAQDFIYLASMMLDSSTQVLTNSEFGEISLAGVQQIEDEVAIDRAGYDHQVAWAYGETSTGGRTLDARFKTEISSFTVRSQYAHVIALRYKEAGTSLASEQSNSVAITARVHHTNASGGDAQLITSASTTIASATADPLALALGSGAQQTFTAADPRLLRLQIEVTAVNGGGSYILDYDGTCASSKCSSLDTPVVTVPEYGIVFAAVAVLIPVAMGGVWRRKRLVMRSRHAHDPSAHTRRGKAERD